MMRNLVTSLVVHERVTTTDAKAKELRRVAERLVTKAARLTDLTEKSRLTQAERARLVHARRIASKHVRAWATDNEDNEVDVLWKLFTVLGPRFADRPGGYTRIVKLPKMRKGDNAPMSLIEFVDYDEATEGGGAEGEAEDGKKKKGLLGKILGGRKKKSDEDE